MTMLVLRAGLAPVITAADTRPDVSCNEKWARDLKLSCFQEQAHCKSKQIIPASKYISGHFMISQKRPRQCRLPMGNVSLDEPAVTHQRRSEHHLLIRESNGWETRWQLGEVNSSSIRCQPSLMAASLPSWGDNLTVPDCAIAEAMAPAWPHYPRLIKTLQLISRCQIGCLAENNCQEF